ncbi:MAG: ABC transporter substrate-binding protein [Actinomycetota bacterium]|nr:ABC transporter substrate-binding protein [Actinomycetota bacterium]
MGRLKVPLLAGIVAVFAFVAVSCGGSGSGDENTLVYGTAADPTALDGALISDGESIRILYQMTEGLTALKPGTSEVIPSLATDWTTSDDGLAWTFNLREDVTFHDGEPFNAEAVCFNFERWFNFPAALQGEGTTYYWQFGFGGGFKNPTEGSIGPEDSLYKSCEAVDESTVTLNLTKPSATILSTLTLPSIHIVSPAALEEFEADAGAQNDDGIFTPDGTYSTEHPTGTGPYKFESWTVGEQLVLVRNDDYWGEQALTEKVIFRPIGDNAARLQALQTGEIQGYDLVEPQDVSTIEGDGNLQLLERPPFNVGWVTINHAKPPMDKLEVRQAVSHAINREEIVNSFYGGRGVVATQFMPKEIVGYADDVQIYEYSPQKARQLLQQAGLTLPVEVEFWYPTDISRDYMPDPKRNFEAMAADLNAAGFKVTARTAPWRPDYVSRVNAGTAGHLNLIGWIADFADADNFIGTFFQAPSDSWGFENPEIHDLLNQAEEESDPAQREQLYQEANRKIMAFAAGVPYAHNKAALAFSSDVQGFIPSPVGVGGESFATVEAGGATDDEETETSETETTETEETETEETEE